MPPTRIGVGKMPRLLRDIVVTSLAHQPDMEVVDLAESAADLGALLGETSCDAFVLSSERSEKPAGVDELLRNRPRVCVVAIEAEGRQVAMYETTRRAGVRRNHLSEVSMAQLAAMIRACVSRCRAEG